MNNRTKMRGTLYFQQDIAGGTSGYIDGKEFKMQGSISEVHARFYSGQEGTLKVKPVLMDAQGTYDEIVDTFGDKGKGVLCGEDDNENMVVDVPFDKGDKVRLYYENISNPPQTYTVKVIVIYYYEGGASNGR